METIDTNSCFVFAWETFKKRPWFFIGFTALVFGISIISTMLRSQLSSVGNDLLNALSFVVSVGISIYVGFVQTKLYLKAHDSVTDLKVKDFLSTKNFLKFAVLYLVLGLALVVGFVLLIIPGIILSLFSIFAVYLYVDKGLSPFDSFKASVELSKDHVWEIFIFMLELICVNILGAIALLVGLLVSVPVSMLAVVHLYRLLQKETPLSASVVPQSS